MKKGYFDERHNEWIIPLRDKEKKYLDLGKNKKRFARDKYDNTKKYFLTKKVIWALQSGSTDKIILLQEFIWLDSNSTEIRLGYYTTTKKGRWWWGQSALMIPKDDLKELILYAVEKGILPKFF